MRWLVACLALSAIACSADMKARSQNAGPNYSTVPCADNCGGDATCLSRCTPTGNNPPPAGVLTHH